MSRAKLGTGRALSKPIAWLLRDEFSDTRAAGSVNGTMPTPGPGGTRAATDSSALLSISGGEATPSAQSFNARDPALGNNQAYDRIPGRFVLGKIASSSTFGGGTTDPMFGWVTSLSGSYTNNSGAILFDGTALLSAYQSSLTTVVSVTNNTYYNIVITLRSAGFITMIFVGGIWQIVAVDSRGTVSSLYVQVYNISGGRQPFKSDYIRIPADLWLPTPLVSDGFGSTFGTTDGLGHAEGVTGGIGSGGGNVAWTGSTWSASGGKSINTPGVGSEILTNTEFTTDAGSWSAINTATLTRRDFSSSPNIAPTGGVDNFGLEVASGGNTNSAAQASPTLTNNVWYFLSARMYSPSADAGVNVAKLIGAQPSFAAVGPTVEDAWQTVVSSARATGTVGDIRLRCASSTGGDVAYFDALSLRPLTLADLFSSCLLSTADVFAGVDLVIVAGTQAGLVLNLDSTSSPANFVIAYHDGTNAKLEKCVAGTYTSVISAAATYSSGARLVVSKIGTAYRLYYNNALVGSGTISDSGIVNNTRHGLFSTYASNTMDNFTVYASGSGGEYNVLNRYVNL